MKRLIPLFIAVAFCLPAIAQQDPDYESRYNKLYKEYVKRPDDVAAMLGLAEFYADTLNPMRNYATAMKYITAAEKRYVDIVQDRDKYKEASRLMKKKITVLYVRECRRNITLLARDYLENAESLSAVTLDVYAEAFRNDETTMRIIDGRRFQARYEQTKRERTLAAYKSFLESYAATLEGEEAANEMYLIATETAAPAVRETQVDTLLAGYLDMPPVQKAAIRRKSAIAYANTVKNPSPAAYRQFLKDYPGSDEYSVVLEKLEQNLQNEFHQLRTPRQLADFATDNPDNPLSDKAIAKIKRLITDERDMEALKIYLDEFPLDVSYNDIYLAYYNWHTEEGNLAPVRKFADEHPDFPYRMALADELGRAARYDSIDITMPFREADIKAWTSKVYHLTGRKESFVALQRTLQQMIAGGDWKNVLARIANFAICFEDICVDEVAELTSIINNPADPRVALTPVVRPAYHMTHPVMHPDGERLFFCKNINGHTSIQYATYTAGKKGGTWRSAGDIVFSNIDNIDIELFSFFDNGERILLGKDGDILVAENSEVGWIVTETLPSPVNSKYNDFDAFMLPDGSGILFASDRPGGQNLQPSRSYFHGDTALASDIYFAPRNGKGWGEPINLGININTPYMECSPVLSKDMKTLYFITDGRGGLGYGDLYYSTRDNACDWRSWSKPVNYGKEVNSGMNEVSVSISDDKTLFLSSNAAGRYGCYSTAAAHNFNDAFRSVAIRTAATAITAQVIDIASQTAIEKTRTIPADTLCRYALFADKEYLLTAHAKGFLVPAIIFTPAKSSDITPAVYDAAALHAMARQNKPLALPGVDFESSRAVLLEHSVAEVEHLTRFLADNPALSVEIIVHVDGNDDAFCFNLSQSRAETIKKAILLSGIDADRVILSPYGNSLTKRQQASTSVSILAR